jgi:hypothetical protein
VISSRTIARPLVAVIVAAALLPASASALSPRTDVVAAAAPVSARPHQVPTIVLEHGANAESSSWQGVIARL